MYPVFRGQVSIVHDWLTGMRGGEKCLEAACRRWPQANLFTLLHKHGSVSPVIEALEPKTSWIGRFPLVDRYYRYLLPLFPWAARWPIPAETELLLSFSHCVAKSARAPEGVPHFCYCFTPMRYAWHMQEAYFKRGRFRQLKSALVDQLMRRIRDWDLATSQNVTHFIAISKTIQQRIQDCYQRDSVVIYPPVDTEFYTPVPTPREDFYLVVSAMAPYKRFDLAIQACERMQRKLIVIGSGQDLPRLRAMAGNHVEFLGWQPDEVIRDHMRRARALLFPGEEDFGIVPVEAQACGCPVIALGRGGASETVIPLESARPTGVFFEEQTVEALCEAITQFEAHQDRLDPADARRNALQFRGERYEAELFGYIHSVMNPPMRVAA